jgi:hypothetical protein
MIEESAEQETSVEAVHVICFDAGFMFSLILRP